jgi:hypothetical protein
MTVNLNTHRFLFPLRGAKTRIVFSAWATAAAIATFSGIALAAENAPASKPDSANSGTLSEWAESIPAKIAGKQKEKEPNGAETGLRLRPFFQNEEYDKPAIEGIDLPGHLFLAFDDVMKTFEFPIKSDATGNSASGYFMLPENAFYLNDELHIAKVGVKRFDITRNDVRRVKGRLYISTESLASWFGINSEIDRAKAIVRFTTDNASFQEAERQKTQPPPNAEASVPIDMNAGVSSGRIANFIQPQNAESDNAAPSAPAQGSPKGSEPDKGATARKEAPAPKEPQRKPTETADKPDAIAFPRNWAELAIVRDNQTLGKVEGYIDLKGTFIRLDRILQKLGVSYNRPDAPYALDIILKDGRVVSLNLPKHEYVDNGQHHTFYDNDVITNEDKIFVNITLLDRILPSFQFVEDLAGKKIEVSETGKGIFGLGGSKPEDLSSLAPAPLASPVGPVIIDDLAGRQKISPQPTAGKQEEANDVLHVALPPPEQAAAPQVPSVPAPAVTGEKTPPPPPKEPVRTAINESEQKTEELILQPRIKKLPPSNEFFEAIDRSGQVYLPLNDLVQILEFPIKIDSANNTANGFFIAPENEFHLDLGKKTVRIGKENLVVADSDVLKYKDQMYVNTESFAKWFGINSEVDRVRGSIHFISERILPQEEENERQRRWQQLLASVKTNSNQYPILQNPYQAIGYPVIDVNIGSAYNHTPQTSGSSNQQNPFTANYNIQGAADLAYMTSQFYAQGATDSSSINTLRLQAGRKDPGGDLLGVMRATEFALGDVTSPSVTLVTSNSLGRGFSLSNKELNTPENFDFRNFTGDSVPGYQVELYRNNVLVAFQTVDANGRYNFTDIPILYGENIFRLVFYGAQGQREEKVETVSASSALLKENQFVYTLNADQRGTSLLPVGTNKVTSINTPPGTEAVGGFRYGLTSNITIGAATAETMLQDGEHRYVTATTGTSVEGILAETNFAKDFTNKGWAGSISALSGFEDVSLRTRYRKFNHFLSEAVNNLDLPLSNDVSLDANTQLYVPLIGDYNVGLSALRETFVDKTRVPRTTYGWRSSKSIWGLSFTDEVNYIIDEAKRFQDTFGVQTRLWNVDCRAVGVYTLKPERQFRDATFAADYRLTDRLSAHSQIEKNLIQGLTSYAQSINWDFDQFRLSFNGQMDSSQQFFAGINILFSINHDQATNRWRAQPQQTSGGGSVSGRAYTDDNSNNQLDDGEKVLPDAKFRFNSISLASDPEGYFVAPVAPYELSSVKLDTSSIKDPLLTPSAPGFRVMTRPGDSIIADFPLVHTTIIDGSVILLDEKGKKTELKDIVVELQDKDGKPMRRVVSAIDGYFSFDKIPAGEYWLTVPDEALSASNASVEAKVHIVIEQVEEFVTGQDITLRQKPPGTPPPSDAAPSAGSLPPEKKPENPPPPNTPSLQPETEQPQPQATDPAAVPQQQNPAAHLSENQGINL